VRKKKEDRRKKKKETTGQKYNGPLLHRAAINITAYMVNPIYKCRVA